MNRTVNLTKRVRTSRGLRYCSVVLAANGRVRADLVIVNGQEERHPEGAYYLEWWEGVKRVRLSVGKDAADASARRLQKEAELNAVNHGVAVTQNGNANGHRSVAVAVTEFLDETKLTKKPKTHAAYSMRLRWPLGNWLLSLRPSKVKLHEGNGDRRWTTCPRIDITSSQIAGPRKTGAAEPTPWEKGARIRSSSPFLPQDFSLSQSVTTRPARRCKELSNLLNLFHRICTPMQTSRNEERHSALVSHVPTG